MYRSLGLLLLIGVIASQGGMGAAGYFSDSRQNGGNIFQAWVSSQWVQTTKPDFDAGVLNQADTASSPGDVKLSTVADWYDGNWDYRRAITLSPATSVANYQVLVVLTTAIMGDPYSHVNSDGSDIRFTGLDGTTLHDYWIESWDNTGTSRIWVEVAGSGTATIFMYYGNTAASSASDGKATFDFFDDFEEHAIGERPDGWTDQGTENFYVALHGSEKWFQVNTWNNWINGSTASGMANFGDAVWSARIYYHQSGTNAWGGIGVHIGNGNVGRIVVIRDGGWYRANEPDWSGGSGWQSNADIHFPLGAKGRIELVTNGTNLDAYWYNPSGYSPEKVTIFTGFVIPPGTGQIDVHVERPNGTNNRWIDADDVIVCKYAAPEPVASVGAEESKYVTSGTIASQVLDTGTTGTVWDRLSWAETLPSNTDITFEVRASDTAFLKDAVTPSWISVGGTSPVDSGLPSGRYLQWRATLTTSDPAETPLLHEVTVEYY